MGHTCAHVSDAMDKWRQRCWETPAVLESMTCLSSHHRAWCPLWHKAHCWTVTCNLWVRTCRLVPVIPRLSSLESGVGLNFNFNFSLKLCFMLFFCACLQGKWLMWCWCDVILCLSQCLIDWGLSLVCSLLLICSCILDVFLMLDKIFKFSVN